MNLRSPQANLDHSEDEAIAVKVALHHAQQFREKFPKQVEHCLRLIGEQLHQGLMKKNNTTTQLKPSEIESLSIALNRVYDIYVDIQNNAFK